MQKVNLAQKLSTFDEPWSPKIVGELNDCHVKVVKCSGEFIWHHHNSEDELFFVVKGTLHMKYVDGSAERELTVEPGEFVIVPRGVEHKPVASEEVHIMLIEPKSTLNTGNVRNDRTVEEPERI